MKKMKKLSAKLLKSISLTIAVAFFTSMMMPVEAQSQSKKKKSNKVEAIQSTEVSQSSGDVEIFIKGGSMRGANGIAWGPDNMLYVGSAWSDATFIVDPETGDVRKIEESFATDDVAFHPDGRMYLNYIMKGEVGVRQTNGDMGIAGKVLLGTDGITVSKDGRVFVSGQFYDSHFFEIDPDGKKDPRMITDLGQKYMSNAMAFGPDGKLYGTAWVTGDLIRLDTETGEVEVVSPGKVPSISSIKFNSKGEAFLNIEGEGKIYKVDIETGERTLYAQLPIIGTDNMCISPDDRFFATNAQDGIIWEITGENTQRVIVEGGLAVVGGVAITNDNGKEKLVVVDNFSLRRFDTQTAEQLSAVRDVLMITEYGWMLTVSNYEDNLVSASWAGNFIKIIDNNDSILQSFDKFNSPTNAIAIGEDIVFCDMQGNVLQFSPKSDNPYQTKTFATGLKQPFGLAYDEDKGNLYVSDEGNNNIVQVLEGGKRIVPRAIASNLRAPQGIALHNGELLVVEAGSGKLLSVSLTDKTSKIVAEGMLFTPGPLVFTEPLTWPRASIVVSGNTAYVAGSELSCIYKVGL